MSPAGEALRRDGTAWGPGMSSPSRTSLGRSPRVYGRRPLRPLQSPAARGGGHEKPGAPAERLGKSVEIGETSQRTGSFAPGICSARWVEPDAGAREDSMRRRGRRFTALTIALLLTAGVTSRTADPARGQSADPAAEIARLKEEIERLKGMVPDQSHVMKDVAYHFSNLWFAGQARNWPLAAFYVNETRSHLRWAVRVRPLRQTTAGPVSQRTTLAGM